MYKDRLIEGVYEVGRWDGLRCHDTHAKFYTDLFRLLKLIGGYTGRKQMASSYFRKVG
jgi:tRNA 2-selenouridine synthase SelU